MVDVGDDAGISSSGPACCTRSVSDLLASTARSISWLLVGRGCDVIAPNNDISQDGSGSIFSGFVESASASAVRANSDALVVGVALSDAIRRCPPLGVWTQVSSSVVGSTSKGDGDGTLSVGFWVADLEGLARVEVIGAMVVWLATARPVAETEAGRKAVMAEAEVETEVEQAESKEPGDEAFMHTGAVAIAVGEGGVLVGEDGTVGADSMRVSAPAGEDVSLEAVGSALEYSKSGMDGLSTEGATGTEMGIEGGSGEVNALEVAGWLSLEPSTSESWELH